MAQGISTLANTEARFTPVVYIVLALAAVLGFWLLHVSCLVLVDEPPLTAAWGLWWLCLLAWASLSVSNLRYLFQHGRTTVGMLPVSVLSLTPAGLCGLVFGGARGAVFAAACMSLAFGVGMGALLCVGFARMHAAYAHAPNVAGNAVVIVLGGAVRNGVPCRTLAARLDVAAALWEQDHNRRFVLTGGRVPGSNTTEAQAMAAYLTKRGVPTERMALETDARNTHENMELSLALARRGGLSGQLCVLTSDYHLYRAVREGEALGVELVPIAAPTPSASRLQQWCREVLTILAKR